MLTCYQYTVDGKMLVSNGIPVEATAEDYASFANALAAALAAGQ